MQFVHQRHSEWTPCSLSVCLSVCSSVVIFFVSQRKHARTADKADVAHHLHRHDIRRQTIQRALSRILPLAVVCNDGGQHYHTTLTHDKVVHDDSDDEAPCPLCVHTRGLVASVNHIHSKAAFKNRLWIAIDTPSAEYDSANTIAVFIIFIIISVTPMTMTTSAQWQSDRQQKQYHVVRAKGPTNSRMDHHKQTSYPV